ncbi:MAG TPA: PfkB family carbohydrate kinase, partial [Vicinamibacterales bacterium]
MSEGLRERLHARLRAMRGREVVVIGDLLADEFIYGRVERVSREAPVLILRYDRTIIVPGGAGNAAANVAALGGIVRLVGLAGRDEPGRRMLASLPSRVRGDTVLRPAGYVTPVKTRILAGGAHSAKQQVVRIDRIVSDHVPDRLRKRIEAAAVRAARRADAVIFSDYGSGLVTPALADAVRRSLKGRRVPLLLDSRYDTLRYRGLTACTPNESEVEQQLGVHLDDDPAALERAGRALLRRTGMEAVLITRGSRGMA